MVPHTFSDNSNLSLPIDDWSVPRPLGFRITAAIVATALAALLVMCFAWRPHGSASTDAGEQVVDDTAHTTPGTLEKYPSIESH